MRTKSAIATFVALGAITAGVQALDTVNATTTTMRGSDTLKGITLKVIQNCAGISPAGSIVYDGTGSGNGQNALTGSGILTVSGGVITETAVQTVAPMSRALNNGICTSTSAASTLGNTVPFDLTGAEGLVFALDGLSIAASSTSTAAAGCNNTGGTLCGQDGTGLRYSGTVGGLAITNWQTVLRLLYAGTNNGGDATTAARDCNSAARLALVANWDELFQGDCPSCDDPVAPNAVRHVWRRDEESGTTDAFMGLLGLPAMNFFQSTTGSYLRNMANSTFCNVKRPTDAYGIPADAQPHTNSATWDDSANAGLPKAAPYFPENQDMDPIRRPCAGTGNLDATGNPPLEPTEQVCGPKGTLGLVLPINPPPDNASAPDPYPAKYCQQGRFKLADAPRNATGGTIGIFCPNGDLPLGTKCFHPTAADGDFACTNAKNSLPGARICNNTGFAGCTTAEGTVVALTSFTGGDGRVYNLHLKQGFDTDTVSGGVYQKIKRPNPSDPINSTTANIIGAFYRIHATRTMHAPFNNGCQQIDATRQIGCLPTVSHCSLGFAGNESVATNPGAVALRVNQILPDDQCVQNLVLGTGNIYPIARKLYVNSLRGFENLNKFGLTGTLTGAAPTIESAPDNEQELIKCFNSTALNGGPDAAASLGFTKLPNGGTPVCEDFNELATCFTGTDGTGPANVNACANNGGVIGNNAAYCGDAITQFPEQCDDGNTVNNDGAGGDLCSNNCTTTN